MSGLTFVITVGVMTLTIFSLAAIAEATADKADDFMAKHPRIAGFFEWDFDEVEAPDRAKKPAARTAGQRNFKQNIYTDSLSRRSIERKVAGK